VHVPAHVTYLFAGLLVAMIAALALEEKLHAKKSMITGIFAVICLACAAFFDILPPPMVTPSGHALPVYVPAIEWEVIAIIVGSSLFIEVVSRSGIFSWTAIKLTKISKGDPLKLLIYYCSLTVIFSAVLNNVTAMIIVGSLTSVSLGKLKRNDLMLGFLLTEGFMTNLGGLLTLISSVPNIILGNAAGISFVKFFYVAGPYVLVATAVTILLAVKFFGITSLKTEEEKEAAAALVMGFDETDGIDSRPFFNLSWFLLLAFIGTIASTTVLPYIKDLGMGYVAVSFAIVALLRYKHEVDRSYAALDWDLLAFFAYLFVVINTMEHAGVLHALGDGIGYLIGLGDTSGGAALLWSSAVASSLTDNVPLAAVMANILSASPEEVKAAAVAGTEVARTPAYLWWSTIFGTNLGGNFTPIGSASTVVAVAIIHKNNIELSFGSFVVKAIPFGIAQLVLATGYVMLFLR
jgi:Na+/H+ antiporter NhaD/arsenite permease-like protein